jgi:hypothetical protein
MVLYVIGSWISVIEVIAAKYDDVVHEFLASLVHIKRILCERFGRLN